MHTWKSGPEVLCATCAVHLRQLSAVGKDGILAVMVITATFVEAVTAMQLIADMTWVTRTVAA